MKNLIKILLLITVIISGCKKDDPEPEVKTVEKIVTNTVTVIQKDTVYCTPKSDIIQGTWYCYQTNNTINTTTNSPSQTVVFTTTTMNWTGTGTVNNISYSSNYSEIYSNSSLYFTITVFNCNELRLKESNGFTHWLRRNP